MAEGKENKAEKREEKREDRFIWKAGEVQFIPPIENKQKEESTADSKESK